MPKPLSAKQLQKAATIAKRIERKTRKPAAEQALLLVRQREDELYTRPILRYLTLKQTLDELQIPATCLKYKSLMVEKN